MTTLSFSIPIGLLPLSSVLPVYSRRTVVTLMSSNFWTGSSQMFDQLGL